MSRILDNRFKYVNAASTDIRRTFKRLERERKAKEEEAMRNLAEAQSKVVQVTRKRAG